MCSSDLYKEYLQSSPATVFEGYGTTKCEGRVVAILKDQKPVDSAGSGDEIEFLTDKTPFYGESGGQVGDSGRAFNHDIQLELNNRSEEHTSELQSQAYLVCRLLLEKKKLKTTKTTPPNYNQPIQ